MNSRRKLGSRVLAAAVLMGSSVLWADNMPGQRRPESMPRPESITIQCPSLAQDPKAVCVSIACGDGFVKMADGSDQYVFGFQDIWGVDPAQVWTLSRLGAENPAPTITAKEGQHLYLTLSNLGMTMRPDLFDPHTVHYHGFPHAAPVFDGEPMASFGVEQNNSVTYFYDLQEPGTFMYHCHQEASEHMQMGMLGNLYILPIQDDLPDGTNLNGFTHHAGYKYVYDDGDGSTYYDVEFPLQLSSFDPDFHYADLNIQPPPFSTMHDVYPMINGRGYPDTMNPGQIMNSNSQFYSVPDKPAQKINSIITVQKGKKALLRISSLCTTEFNTLTAPGLPLVVIGQGAHILRGPDGAGGAPGKSLFYKTNTINLGGGESADVIVDTSTVAAGTYFLYCRNLNQLNNNHDDYGGMMTEFVVTP